MSLERAHLVLADGTIFEGRSFGAKGVAVGELFVTNANYAEPLTDPAMARKLVALTAPLVGNVGMVAEDAESMGGLPQPVGLIVRDASPMASNFRASETLDAYLERHGVVALRDLDTRALTRHLRESGRQAGAIGAAPVEELLRRAREASLAADDLVREVTAKEPYTWTEGSGEFRGSGEPRPLTLHVVALDLGMKRSLLRRLVDAGCRVTAMPATATAEEILAHQPDGLFLSSGPGNPATATYAIETVRALLGKLPIFGVGLGHQILALALGGATYELSRARLGANQPVLELATGKVEITTQTHAFAVDEASLSGRAEVTHVHLNDRTVSGLASTELRAFSVQHQAAAGPHDSVHLFDAFAKLMTEAR